MLPAEWEPQRFVQLTWPHEETDWAPYLTAAQECFCNIAREVSLRQPLLVVTPEPEEVCEQLRAAGVNLRQVVFQECPTNDTWARDHGFITTRESSNNETEAFNANDEGGNALTLHDFCFNGWGMKFASNLDNQINSRIFEEGVFEDHDELAAWDAHYENNRNIVLEGGSIESDGCGSILTTTECLLSKNRNEGADKSWFEKQFAKLFGAKRVLWLDHGFLVGDDTDSHVDTLARLCPDNTIVYVQCKDENDIHYDELKAMEEQLQSFTTADGQPYRLLPLPMPEAILESDFDDAVEEEGDQRLPATYANFLIINDAVLYPTYNQPENDAKAKEILKQAFPGREIVGIDCRVLIRQHGSLHCVTMQYPY